MTPDEVLALARKGNPKVLSAILNRSTQSHGISVRVAQKHDDLHILLEGAVINRSDVLATFIQESLQKLKVDPAYGVIVYGRQQGKRSVAWSHALDLKKLSAGIEKNGSEHVKPVESKMIGPTQPQVQSVESHEGEIEGKSVESHGRSPHPLDDSAALETMTTEDHAVSSRLERSMTNQSTDQFTSSSPLSTPTDGINEASADAPSDASSLQQSHADEPQESVSAPAPEQDAAQPTSAPSPEPTTMSSMVSPPGPSPAFQEPAPFVDPQQPPVDPALTDVSLFDEQPEDAEEESFDFQAVMQRPEALVIVIFAIVLYIWQLYTTLAQAAAPEGSVSGQELATRLGVSSSTISRRKLQPDFSTWAASVDPDGIAWSYDDGMFFPQMPDFE
ncbi:MAG: hypothetical protein AAFR31_13635 [Cyanobacteria bacterium J06627_8]